MCEYTVHTHTHQEVVVCLYICKPIGVKLTQRFQFNYNKKNTLDSLDESIKMK